MVISKSNTKSFLSFRKIYYFVTSFNRNLNCWFLLIELCVISWYACLFVVMISDTCLSFKCLKEEGIITFSLKYIIKLLFSGNIISGFSPFHPGWNLRKLLIFFCETFTHTIVAIWSTTISIKPHSKFLHSGGYSCVSHLLKNLSEKNNIFKTSPLY